MPRIIRISMIVLFFTLSATACSEIPPTVVVTMEPTLIVTLSSTVTPIAEETVVTHIDTATLTAAANDYDDCGTGTLVEVPYYFKDDDGIVSPTQIVRDQTTSDHVRRYVSVISCLVHDDGWQSIPEEVEKGYENEIIFFDKNGKGHKYRIIIGGHYIAPYDPQHKDLTGSIDGMDEQYYSIDKWLNLTHDHFVSTGVRQIGVDIYLDDTQGNLSKVLEEVYQFRETNLQIEAALKTGEGYPENVPEGFFLFATKAWFIIPD